MNDRRFINRTSLSNREFYRGNATSCGKASLRFISKGDEFLAGWFAKRAASYVLESGLWITRPPDPVSKT